MFFLLLFSRLEWRAIRVWDGPKGQRSKISGMGKVWPWRVMLVEGQRPVEEATVMFSPSFTVSSAVFAPDTVMNHSKASVSVIPRFGSSE